MKNKKNIYLFALCCGALLISGCGSDVEIKENDSKKEEEKIVTTQKLRCSYSEKDNDMTAEMSFIFVYDNKEEKIIDGQMTVRYDYDFHSLSEDEKESADDMMKTMFDGICDTFDNKEGYENCKTTYKDGKFDMIVEFDISNLTSATGGDLKSDMNLDDLKNYFENETEDKMTCTIK